jgi:acetoacetate decarboxylase
MAYPSAPWLLKGYALHTVQLIDAERARPSLPSGFHPVSILPGKTICCVYLASYEQGSVLQYHELIVTFLARYQHNIRFWISHIYVDNEDSVAGGRSIWGLPKELAHFSWHVGEQRYVAVEQKGQLLCQIHFEPPRWLWTQPVLLPVMSVLGTEILSFTGRTHASLGVARGALDIPSQSPLAVLGLSPSIRTYHHRDLTFVAQTPRILGPWLNVDQRHDSERSGEAATLGDRPHP